MYNKSWQKHSASLYGRLNGCNSLHNVADNWQKLLPSDRKNVDIHWPPQRGSTAQCTCWSSADLCLQEGSSSPSFVLIVDHQSSARSKVRTQVRFPCWFWWMLVDKADTSETKSTAPSENFKLLTMQTCYHKKEYSKKKKKKKLTRYNYYSFHIVEQKHFHKTEEKIYL